MSEENQSLLEEEIECQFKTLAYLDFGSQEHAKALDNLVKLYNLKLEEDKNANARITEAENREIDKNFKYAQLNEAVRDRYVRIGIAAAELILPLIFYGIWMRKGFKFEENGTYTSTTFRGLFSRFKPTKK